MSVARMSCVKEKTMLVANVCVCAGIQRSNDAAVTFGTRLVALVQKVLVVRPTSLFTLDPQG